MKGDLVAFVDTNVLVYALSDDDATKRDTAEAIVERGFVEGCYAISTQVLLELYVTLTRKAATKLNPDRAMEYVRALTEWHVVETDSALVLAALALSQKAQISAWDAAILEAARRAGCTYVLTEDLGAGTSYDGVRVENPF